MKIVTMYEQITLTLSGQYLGKIFQNVQRKYSIHRVIFSWLD